ncbi:MAG: FCD domain-containing protein [Caldilineaceae bacterium]
MIVPRIDSEFIRYIFEQGYRPGDRLPSLSDLSAEIGISVGKLREQLEVARTLGLVEASPRRGIICTDYTFVPAVRLSLLAAMAMDRDNFDAFSGLRVHLETAYWNEAVALLTDDDKRYLRELVDGAKEMLNQPRVQIPFHEHRELHLAIFRRLDNPFVLGLLEAYWDAYEAVEAQHLRRLSLSDRRVGLSRTHCRRHQAGDPAQGKQLLVEHMQLLSNRGISMEARHPVPDSVAA